jgi:cyclic pyranopterin phosphate synthase
MLLFCLWNWNTLFAGYTNMAATNSLTAMDVRDTLGRPIGDLRLSVIDKCNLRCTYCMPESEYGPSYEFLKNDALLSFDEIEQLARSFAGIGVTKLRLTGGEPLLRRDLPALISRLVRIEGIEDVALTTNGLLLADQAAALKDAGLQRLTISLDSLDREVASRMSGRPLDPQIVLDAMDVAVAAGFESLKINTVVQRGVNDHTLLDLLRHFRNTPHIVRMIEYMDVGNRNGWRLEDVVSAREMLEMIGAEYPVTPLDKHYRSEVASRYAYADGAGEIGFITSVTNTFCGDCNRARLSADGKLYTCLFSGDGIDLRGPMREGATDIQLTELLAGIWSRRADRYSELRAGQSESPPY